MPSPDPTPLSRSRWAGIPAEERQAERRALLIDAGFDLLGTEGDGGTTVRAVCAAARLNPRYFYESFTDLDELLVAVYDHQISLLAGEVVAAVEAEGDDEAARVRAGLTTIVAFVTDDPRRAEVLYRAALGNEALNKRRIETNHAIVDSLLQWGEQRSGPGLAREPASAVAAAILVGGMGELLLSWLDGRIEVTAEQLVDDAVALFLATGAAAADLARSRNARNPGVGAESSRA